MEDTRLDYCYLVVTFLFALVYTGVRSISEEAVQEKVGKIQVGFTTKSEIENLVGKAHITETVAGAIACQMLL
jgi:hypothetical protein